MSLALAYAPRQSALGRAASGPAAIHLLSFAAVAFVVANPIVLAGCAAAVVIAGLAAGARPAVVLATRWGLTLGVVIIAVNAIASQRGDTILARGPDLPILGIVNISAEALAEGGVLALRIAIVFTAFAVLTASVDPDRLFRIARPIAKRSVLTATLIARLVPLAAADHVRVREAAQLRGPGAAPVGRAAMLSRLVVGSLERSVDIAATLELRGYAGAAPGGAAAAPRAPGDLAFAFCGLVALGLGVAARVGGFAVYDSYPLVAIEAETVTYALAAALPALALVPLALDRLRLRGVPSLAYADA